MRIAQSRRRRKIMELADSGEWGILENRFGITVVENRDPVLDRRRRYGCERFALGPHWEWLLASSHERGGAPRGYNEILSPKKGDVIRYLASFPFKDHWTVYLGREKLRSKWGFTNIVDHDPFTTPYICHGMKYYSQQDFSSLGFSIPNHDPLNAAFL